MTRTTARVCAALGLALLAAACENDTLNRPFSSVPVDPLFERYVSMGNSITAGVQSAGINDSTQNLAYPVLLARAMRSPFFAPLMRRPGCPPPFTNVFLQSRVGGGTPTTCALRSIPQIPPPFISNTAVPSAEVIDIYSNLDTASNANALTQFFLGGLTQTQMMARANPTFVTVWIGNNDVLGAATSGGDTTEITSVADFQARYNAILDTLDAVAPRGAVMISVANVTAIPFFSRGSIYFAIKAGLVPGAAFPPTFTVSANCAPPRGDSVLVPFPYGATLLGTAQAGGSANLDCADTVAAVVVPSELVKLVTAVTAYNTYLSTEAASRGWEFLDINAKFGQLAADTAQVRPFPYFPQGNAGDTVAVRRPFGRAFSLDGIHPSTSAHRLIADTLRLLINGAYGTPIPPIP